GAYLNLCKQVIEDLYYEFGRVDGTSEYGRFLGWILTPPSAPFLYRGLGRDDVSGFADYSAFSQARFNSWRNYWEEMARRETGMATTDVMAGGGPFTGTSAALWEEFTSPAPAQGPPGEVPGTAPTEEPDALAAPAVEPESPPGDQDPDRIQPTGGESQAPADPLAAPADGGAPEAAQGESSFDGADGVVAGFRNAIPDPLPPASKSGPDTRPIWLKWTQFRLLEQQIAVDRLGRHLRRLDQHHPIFATAWGALAYRENNGYEALAWGADPAWIARRPYIDGLVIPFELSSHSFAIPSGAGDSDNLHAARAMADLAQRYNKIPLLAVERSVTNPPAVGDLAALQQWCVAAGVDPIWSANGFFTRGSTWAKEEIRQFARGAPYAALPFPSQKPEPTVTVLDSPLLLGNNYCDGSPRLPRASHIPDILTGAGFDVEVLFPQEFPDIGGPTPPLGKVCFLLQEDLIQPRGFDQFTVGFQTAQKDQDAAARRRNMAGPVLEIMDDSEL
ncbi:MAG TPA: hypothetical protein VEI97_06805, partial [bacterium]|nr:hypothetical protein [bacterium]